MTTEDETAICGVIMPISSIDGCSEGHWSDVRDIIFSAIRMAGYEPNLVSDADDVGVIHQRIVQNIYENPIIVCDISARNANVMFELGMRLAFDRPVIIIKDDKTPYSFDTSSIEHLEYPRDLRFNKIEDFKSKLSSKIAATADKFRNDPNAKTFLSHYGQFKVAKIDTIEVSGEKFIISELTEIRRQIERVNHEQRRLAPPSGLSPVTLRFSIPDHEDAFEELFSIVMDLRGVRRVSKSSQDGNPMLIVQTTRRWVEEGIKDVIASIIRTYHQVDSKSVPNKDETTQINPASGLDGSA